MNIENELIKPTLRWAGGKRWLINRILNFIPKKYNDYHEPFVGGASIYLNIKPPNSAFLSDLNNELIEFYVQVRDNLPQLIAELKKYKNEEQYYYKIRATEKQNQIGKAARFYYLNRTCFNGLYRVNQNGKFNVPFGYRNVNILEEQSLKVLSEKLQTATIQCNDFYQSIGDIKRGDFIFLDPPYTVAHNNNGFIQYNQKIFSWDDQKRLAEFVSKVIEKKAFFLMTNAYHDSIKNLYKNVGKHLEIERHSTISGVSKSRIKVSELIITNCI